MTRAAALILKGGRVALIERRSGGETYYLFPGGQIEDYETPEQAAVREVLGELGLEAGIERLVADVVYEGAHQFFFLAHVSGGEFGSGRGPEAQGDQAEDGSYHPVWLDIRGLSALPVYPKAVALLVEFSENGWPREVMQITDRVREKPLPTMAN